MKKLLVLILAVSALNAADWPQFRGNNALTGISTDSLPEKPSLLWTYETKDNVQSQAVIAGNSVFVSTDRKIFALELSTGKLLWEYEKPEWRPSSSGSIKSSPLVSDGVLYSGDASGFFYALETSTGKPKWSFNAES